MRKLLIIFILLLLVVSCNKEADVLLGGDASGEAVSFTATVVDMTDTKAMLINSWSGGEEVALFAGETLYPYTVAADGTMSGDDITVEREVSITYTAFYPYDSALTTIEEYEAACTAGNVDYMSAITTTSGNDVTLQFEHSMAALSFTILIEGPITDPAISLALDGDFSSAVALEVDASIGSFAAMLEASFFVAAGTDISSAMIKVEHSGSEIFHSIVREDTNTIEMGKHYPFSYTTGVIPTGSGVVEDPYIIYSADDMRKVGTDTEGWSLSAHYILGWDIDLGDDEFSPIGDPSRGSYFTGSFDGDGHEISGLYINQPSSTYKAIFSYIDGATVKNLGVSGSVVGKNYTACIVAYAHNSSLVENCYSKGSVESTGDFYNYPAGVVSMATGGSTVKGCYNMCSVVGNCSTVGGVIGGSGGAEGAATLIDCYNLGSVIGTGNYIGGVVGNAMASTTITNCYNEGSVEGPRRTVGGVAGYVQDSEISRCYNTGTVTGATDTAYSFAGGVVGGVDGTVAISSCYNTGSVTGSCFVGGVVSSISHTCTLVDCYNTGSVKGIEKVGGVVGSVSYNDSAVSRIYNIGTVEGSSYISGVVGYTYADDIIYCYYDSDVVGNIGAAEGSDDGIYYCGFSTELMQGAADAEGSLLYYFTNEDYGNSSEWKSDYAIPINNGYPILSWQ